MLFDAFFGSQFVGRELAPTTDKGLTLGDSESQTSDREHAGSTIGGSYDAAGGYASRS